MRILNREDYEKIAREVVAQYVSGATPLTDGIAKISESMGLNPDQIRALVRVANTVAHLDLFDRTGNGDKIVEFTPADPKDVLERVYRVEGESCSSEPSNLCDVLGELPDMHKRPAPAASPAPALAPEAPSVPQQITIIKIRKVASELHRRGLTAALAYEEGIDKLAATFARLYGPDFYEFEKDAVDVHGSAAISVLADLRKLLRLPGIKTAVFGKLSRVVDTQTPEMLKFAELLTLVEEAKACSAGEEYINRRLGGAQ